MAYEKQNWQTGEVITADKLNHMEDGVGNADGNVVGIKIATWNLDGGPIASDSTVYSYGGGGMLDNQKSLYDLIGDRRLLSFTSRIYDADGQAISGYPLLTHVEFGTVDPVLKTIEEREGIKGGNVLLCVYTDKGVKKADIYAVCI